MTAVERLGAVLSYAYVLRVPLLTWAALVALPFVAVPFDAALGPLLRGLFDLSDPPERAPVLAALFGALAFFLVTVAALMAAAAVAITARLILRDGAEL